VTEQKTKSKILKSSLKVKNLIGRHYLAIEQAYRDGSPTAWATSGTSVEMLYTFNVQPILPENAATISAAQKVSKGYIESAEDLGFSYDLCSYFKTNVGAMVHNAPLDLGGIKPPTFMVAADVICDTHVKWFQTQSKRYNNIPLYIIDVPHVTSNTTNKQKEYYRKYVEEQMLELLDWISELINKEYDEEKSKEVISNSYELSEYWIKIFELRKKIPSPVSTKDTFGGLFPLFTMPGLKSPIRVFKNMYEETKERVVNGIGALENEQFRLLFEGIPFWYNLKFFSVLERWGAIIVFEPYTYAFGKYLDPTMTKDYIINNPIKAMSKIMLSFWYIYDLETRVKEFKRVIKEWSIDGVILHNNLSCRPNACGMYDLKQRLMDEEGIPSLVIDSDMNDPRKMNEEQLKNQLESFMEILQKNKKR